MGRVTPIINATEDEVEKAKQTAIVLVGENSSRNAIDLFFTENLHEIEDGIKQLNEFSSKSWLLSAILLYTLVYNKSLYRQSGLEWAEYAKQSRARLGLDQRDITEQLSAARFFIKYHDRLLNAGLNPNGANAKLARAELAVELSGSVDDTIQHIVHDTWRDYKDWYQSFKPAKALPSNSDTRRDDVRVEKGRYYIGEAEAVKVSDDIPEADRIRINGYLDQIFDMISRGYEPAIVEVYDKKEASVLELLRDKHRRGK